AGGELPLKVGAFCFFRLPIRRPFTYSFSHCTRPVSWCNSNLRTPNLLGQRLPITFFDHLCRRFRIDLCGLKLRVTEEFLYLLDRHSAFKQSRRNRMA